MISFNSSSVSGNSGGSNYGNSTGYPPLDLGVPDVGGGSGGKGGGTPPEVEAAIQDTMNVIRGIPQSLNNAFALTA